MYKSFSWRKQVKDSGKGFTHYSKKENLAMLLGIITYLTVRGGDITSNGRALVRTQSIVAQHNQTTANVLRYLHILEDAGIIVSGKIGTDIFWRLA